MTQVKEHPPLPVAMNGGGEDEIDLRELFASLWRGKWWIVASTLVGAVIAVVVAISLPNIYRSEALLAPSAEQQGGGLAAIAAQFGGLASLAGVNLSGGGGPDKTAIAVEIGKSRQFLSRFIRQHQLEVPLMAVTKADKVTGELVIDENAYDVTSNKWVREVPPGKSVEPTDWELVKKFLDIASISKDAKSGLVTVAVEYYSPESAKQWVDWLVADLNEAMKLRDQTDATRNISYLKAQLEKTPVADMQKVFYQLIEDQTKTLMLTEVNQEYVFKTLDPAVVAEEKAKPKRALIAVLGTLLGGMLGVMIVLVRHAMGRTLS
ncbi:Wzz/FepE/Etk N-terminal domain-containing protein [Aeromonas veronii]|uniref:Wzz/FepE/Etk N-terminal domain-containing protein n=1 Tax=Aeromonas veronii TaxID=654 RepID=UPI0030051D73